MLFFKQELPNTRYKLLRSSLQTLTITSVFSLPGNKGRVCTAITAVYQMLSVVFPPQPFTAGPNSFFCKRNQRKMENRVSARGGFFLDMFSFIKIPVQRNKCAKLWTPRVSRKPRFLGCPWVSGKFSQRSISLTRIFLPMWAPNTLCSFI